MRREIFLFPMSAIIYAGIFLCAASAQGAQEKEMSTYFPAPCAEYVDISATNLTFNNLYLNPSQDGLVAFDYRDMGWSTEPQRMLALTGSGPQILLHGSGYTTAANAGDLILRAGSQVDAALDGGDIRLRTGTLVPVDRLTIDAYGKVVINRSDEINAGDPDTKWNLLHKGDVRMYGSLFVAPDTHSQDWPRGYAQVELNGHGGVLVPRLATSDYMNDYDEANPYRANASLSAPPLGLVLYDRDYDRLMMFHYDYSGFADHGFWLPLLTRDEIVDQHDGVVPGGGANPREVDTIFDYREFPITPVVVMRGGPGFDSGRQMYLSIDKNILTNRWKVIRTGNTSKDAYFTVIAVR